MVKFKVIKGSHLLVWLSALVLLAVVLFILFSGGFSNENNAAPNQNSGIEVQNVEAEAKTAFALNAVESPTLQIEIISDIPELEESEAKHILIYHTHTHEAYQQDENNPYQAVEAWRTLDETQSIVRVGSALADELRKLGFRVTHDTTDHEQDSLSDSYVRSLSTLESYVEEFDLCIDLHRDAYTDGARACLESSSVEYAQLMMLVGRGDNYGDADKPDYESNLSFAQHLTGSLNRIVPEICRNVTVKAGRYNQHIGKYNALIEVGHNMNTLQQALNSVPVLAQGILKTMQRYD